MVRKRLDRSSDSFRWTLASVCLSGVGGDGHDRPCGLQISMDKPAFAGIDLFYRSTLRLFGRSIYNYVSVSTLRKYKIKQKSSLRRELLPFAYQIHNYKERI